MKRTALRTHRITKQTAIVAKIEAEMAELETDEQVNEWYARWAPAKEQLEKLYE